MSPKPNVSGDDLIRARRWSRSRYEKLVAEYRKKGATDRDLLAAMQASRLMIDRVGSLTTMKAPRPQYRKK